MDKIWLLRCRNRLLAGLLLGLSLLFAACQPEIGGRPKVRWRITPEKGRPILGISPVFLPQGILCSQLEQDSILRFAMRSETDGHILWQYADTAAVHQSFLYNLSSCVLGNRLFIPSGPLLLAIDVQQGSITWKTRLPLSGEDHLSTDGQYLYRCYMKYDFSGSEVYRIDPASGQHTRIDSVAFQAGERGFARTPVPLGQGVLAYTYMQESLSDRLCRSVLRVIDAASGAHHLEKQVYGPTPGGYGVNKQPHFDAARERLYLVAHDYLICMDTRQWKERWRTHCTRDILSSDILVTETAVFWPGEDGFLRSIDTNTGALLWKTPVSGTPGKLFYRDGYLWVLGGGNGLLQVIDAENGQLLHAMASPNQRNYPGIQFERAWSVSPVRPLAIVHDGRDYFLVDL
jgi:outer membrane protein assembly factor BamB